VQQVGGGAMPAPSGRSGELQPQDAALLARSRSILTAMAPRRPPPLPAAVSRPSDYTRRPSKKQTMIIFDSLHPRARSFTARLQALVDVNAAAYYNARVADEWLSLRLDLMGGRRVRT
jgi:hypothetical protein